MRGVFGGGGEPKSDWRPAPEGNSSVMTKQSEKDVPITARQSDLKPKDKPPISDDQADDTLPSDSDGDSIYERQEKWREEQKDLEDERLRQSVEGSK